MFDLSLWWPTRCAGVSGRLPTLAALLTVILLGWADLPAYAQPASPPSAAGAAAGQVNGQVVGRIVGAAPKEAAGAKVVLVKFTLDAQGVPQGAPIQMQDADSQGRYKFNQVPIDLRAVYKLGARVAGRLVASEPFTFPEGQRLVQLNLTVPGLVSDATGLYFKQALVAFEPTVGAVWVTEVMHVGNPTTNVIDAVNAPIELNVPEGASDLKMIREEQEAANHSHLGSKLLVYGRIQPGDTTIAFRYRLGAALGAVQVEKRYPHAVEEMLVLAPKGSLKLVSEQLSPRQPQQFEGVTYDTWGSQRMPADRTVLVKAQGIPIRQELFLIPLLGFFAAMGGMLWWFFRKRLPRQAAT